MSQKISQSEQTSGTSNKEEATEKARRSGMTKRIAGAAKTGREYEQGAAGINRILEKEVIWKFTRLWM